MAIFSYIYNINSTAKWILSNLAFQEHFEKLRVGVKLLLGLLKGSTPEQMGIKNKMEIDIVGEQTGGGPVLPVNNHDKESRIGEHRS